MLFTNQKLPADLKLVGVKTRGAVIGQFESDPVRVRVISLESLDGEDWREHYPEAEKQCPSKLLNPGGAWSRAIQIPGGVGHLEFEMMG